MNNTDSLKLVLSKLDSVLYKGTSDRIDSPFLNIGLFEIAVVLLLLSIFLILIIFLKNLKKISSNLETGSLINNIDLFKKEIINKASELQRSIIMLNEAVNDTVNRESIKELNGKVNNIKDNLTSIKYDFDKIVNFIQFGNKSKVPQVKSANESKPSEIEKIFVDIDPDQTSIIRRTGSPSYFYLIEKEGEYFISVNESILNKTPDSKYEYKLEIPFRFNHNYHLGKYKVIKPAKVSWNSSTNSGEIIEHGEIAK